MIGKATGADSPKEPPVSARLVSLEGLPNEMVLHLDNGQVWQQLDGGGSLSLKPGEAVKIERHLGAYWLSGAHVSGVKVRQK